MLLDLPSVETPLRYFGGKSKACRILSEFVPSVVNTVLSPFFGGGSFELYLTGRGVRVYGSEGFPPVANFWEILLESPQCLHDKVRRVVEGLRWETWMATALEFARQESECPITRAAQCLILYNFSFNHKGIRDPSCSEFYVDSDGVPRPTRKRGSRLILYERLANFANPFLSVECLDFRDAFAKHPDMFAYCDPPYPSARAAYGDSRVYHEDFDHEALASILHARNQWVLSYNDTEVVRDLYPETDYEWTRVRWTQASKKHNFKGNDVIICSRD